MAIRFEEVEAVRARNIDVFDGGDDGAYIGEISNEPGKPFYFIANDFVTKITAKTLREIADKLDELNKEKK